jgi:hypothetical protein
VLKGEYLPAVADATRARSVAPAVFDDNVVGWATAEGK